METQMTDVGFDRKYRPEPIHYGRWLLLFFVFDAAVWLSIFYFTSPNLMAAVILPLPSVYTIPALILGNTPFLLNLLGAYYLDIPNKLEMSWIVTIIVCKVIGFFSFFFLTFTVSFL